MRKNKIGWLVYHPEKKRRKKNSFDDNSNIGARVIIELIKQGNGVEVTFCSSATASEFEIVLVSFTSTYDIYAFYKEVALKEEWQLGKRKFLVIGGGFGMQNPTTIRNYVDYAVFGRAETFICQMMDTILGGSTFEHQSVMNLPDIHKVVLGQADHLLDFDFFHEKFVGCARKCKFCHYSWIRKPLLPKEVHWQLGGHGEDVYGIGGGGMEMMLKEITSLKKKPGRVRTGLDGYSERLRFLYGKKITNEQLTEAVEHIGNFDGVTFFDVYNIGSMPTETEEDREELIVVLKKMRPKNRVILIMNVTPFRPSLCTPLMFAPVSLLPDFSKLQLKNMVPETDERNFRMSYGHNESPFSHFKTLVVERATEDTDRLFHTICFSTKIRNLLMHRAMKVVKNNFDITPYLREYSVEEDKYPGWFLHSYTSHDVLKKAYLWTKEREDKKWINKKFV